MSVTVGCSNIGTINTIKSLQRHDAQLLKQDCKKSHVGQNKTAAYRQRSTAQARCKGAKKGHKSM